MSEVLKYYNSHLLLKYIKKSLYSMHRGRSFVFEIEVLMFVYIHQLIVRDTSTAIKLLVINIKIVD